jgi:hypothetical protein
MPMASSAPDPDWESAWLGELDRRAEAAKARGGTASEWTDVRARILKRERGETLPLTREEADHYYATGELPERAWHWAASHD